MLIDTFCEKDIYLIINIYIQGFVKFYIHYTKVYNHLTEEI